MIKNIKIGNKKIEYLIKNSQRAKRMNLRVGLDGLVVISKPIWVRVSVAEKFAHQKSNWILNKLKYFTDRQSTMPPASRSDFLDKKNKALFLVQEKIEIFNKIYKFKFNRISIRNTKTRWGSCSYKRNLNFNYRLIYLPDKLANYIVVHELCHLKELNHSEKFWQLVKQTIPDYLEIRKKLRQSF